MKLWEILKEIHGGRVEPGTIYIATDSIIQLEIEYDGYELVYSNIMGDTESRQTVVLCSGEIHCNYDKIN